MFPWDRLRTLRSARRPLVSQEDVAKRLGCSQAYVSQVELGQKDPGRSFCNELELLTAEWGDTIKASDWDAEGVHAERVRLEQERAEKAAAKLAGAA